MLKSLTYLCNTVRYPELARLGFLSSGRAIERRRGRFAANWKPHLDMSREEQIAWAKTLEPGTSLAVLGAGRLFDVALEELAAACSEIVLYDADPQCSSAWSSAAGKLRGTCRLGAKIGDLTNVLPAWSSRLRDLLSESRPAGWKQTLRQIAERFCEGEVLPESSFIWPRRHGAILSINLLSQIAVYWQHLLERKLQKTFGRAAVREHEQEWLEAFLPAARALVEQHLRDLGRCGAAQILLITDVSYEHSYRDSSGREVLEQIDALYGCDVLAEDYLRKFFSDYQVKYGGTWHWDIAPRSRSRGVGERHRVAAISFTRSA